MRFARQRRDEPELNLIPFIDILLVILIFLMLTTTYSKFTEMQINLPTADTETLRDQPRELIVSVSSDGRYTVARQPIEGRSVDDLMAALSQGADNREHLVLIISADAMAPHQSVVSVMEAARRVGLGQITFATQTSGNSGT